MVSAEIAVAMAVPIENPADCFLQTDEILGYLAEEASSLVELFCCTTMYVRILPGRQDLLREQFHWNMLEHRPYSPDLAPSNFFPFPNMKEHLAGERIANDKDLKNVVVT